MTAGSRLSRLERKLPPMEKVDMTEEDWEEVGVAITETILWVLSALSPDDTPPQDNGAQGKALALVKVIQSIQARLGASPVTLEDFRALPFSPAAGAETGWSAEEVEQIDRTFSAAMREATKNEMGTVLKMIRAPLWHRHSWWYNGPK